VPDDDLGAQLVDLIDGAAEPVTFDEVRARDARHSRARGRLTAAVAVAAVIAVAIGVAVATRDGTSPAPTPVTTPTSTSTPEPRSVTSFDFPSSFSVVQSVPAQGSLWLAGSWGLACTDVCPGLSRWDPSARDLTEVTGVPDGAIGVTAAADAVFVLSDRPDGGPYHVTRVDLPDATVRYTVDVPDTHVFGNTNPLGRIAVGFGSVWVYEGNDYVARLDAETGRQIARIELPPDTASNGLAVNPRGVWSIAWGGTAVTLIDPETNTASIATNFVPGFAQSIAADDGFVWTTNVVRNLQLYRVEEIEPQLFEAKATDVPTANVAAGDGEVWFLGWIPGDKVDSPRNHPGRVGRVDPESLAVTVTAELPIGTLDETHLSVGDGAAWVVDSTTHQVWRIDAGS
jgi:hypothetical protein